MADPPNPHAEETDVFLVRGSERRARGKKVPDTPVSTTATTSESPWVRPPQEAAPPVVESVSGVLPAPEPSAAGFLDGAHTPTPGGYEARILAIKPVPAARLRRAVFAMTGGRVNLG
ncbi:hypothetical protein AB0I72_21900 [Nocardiopsis sp. NPDC049922]|uniref:hypothetical protein n=1 Tax=Nocardiopsis sp. NPDC049922 TaxID=3155157 RepID=UPI0033F001C7